MSEIPQRRGLGRVIVRANLANMLGHLSILHYSRANAVTMCQVQRISREGNASRSRPQRLHAKPLQR